MNTVTAPFTRALAAITINPQRWQAYGNRAVVNAMKGDTTIAKSSIKAAIA